MTSKERQNSTWLRVRNLSKRFGDVQAVDDVEFEIQKGNILALLGPSGCGKTTTLRIIAGLTLADSGQVFLEDKDLSDVPTEKRGIGMVFQTWALFPHMTVYQNIAFGLHSRHVLKADIPNKVNEALDLVKLPGIAGRKISQLSGGQQQRVALVRALTRHPKLMLFDEPLSNLDQKLRVGMRTELKNLQMELGLTGVYVTHDQGEALSLGDVVAVMREGKILDRRDARSLFEKPRTRFVADFLGVSNILSGELRTENDQLKFWISPRLAFDVVMPPKYQTGLVKFLGIRPRKITLVPKNVEHHLTNAFPVIVLAVDYLGTEVTYIVEVKDIPGLTLTVTQAGGAYHKMKEEIIAGWNAEDALLLDSDDE